MTVGPACDSPRSPRRRPRRSVAEMCGWRTRPPADADSQEFLRSARFLEIRGLTRTTRPRKFVAIRRRPLTSDDSRTGVQCTKTVQSMTQRLQRLLSFRSSPQEGLHSTIGPLHQLCRAVALLPTLTTTSSFHRRDSAPPTITFKLFDVPLHELSAAKSTILVFVG